MNNLSMGVNIIMNGVYAYNFTLRRWKADPVVLDDLKLRIDIYLTGVRPRQQTPV